MQICWEKLANWLIKESEKEGEFPIKICTFPVGSLSKYPLVYMKSVVSLCLVGLILSSHVQCHQR